jgi:hypothetical protein
LLTLKYAYEKALLLWRMQTIFYFWVLMCSVVQHHKLMKNLWLKYFTWALGLEKALATLEPRVALLELETLKTFVLHHVVHRRSNLQLEGVMGWSY